MLHLRPRIGKVDVQGVGAMSWQEVLQKIPGLDAYTAEVRQSEASAFAVDFIHASKQAFNADEVLRWIGFGIVQQEGGVATAKFDI